MKNVIVVVMLAVGFSGLAQKGEGTLDSARKNLTSEQVATLQTKRMTLSLDLTEAQQSQVQALNLENAKMRKAKMEAFKAKKADEEKKRPTSEEIYAMQNERLDHQIAQRNRMKEILSEEQFVKWEKMGHKKSNHHFKRGKKGVGKKHSAQKEKK